MSTRRSFIKKGLLATGAIATTGSISGMNHNEGDTTPKYNLPYKNTYNKEPLVTDNEYRNMKATQTPIPSYEEARKVLPSPIWDGHDKELEMYWAAWKIAVKNLRHPMADSGFVSTYIDTAYNGNIFMWDTAFITMFARYGRRAFPFQQTLNNFYSRQHPDGFICREIKADGADCFERYDPVSTGPNLLPWSEMLYFKQTGDMDRLHEIFPALCAYYKWLQLNRTWPDGTYWSSGWGTGMDNMPRVLPKYNPIYSHGHMVWLDTNLQQIFTAQLLLDMGFYIERWQEIEDFEEEAKKLSAYVKDHLWENKQKFLFDRYADGTLCPTMGIGAYWALHTNILNKEQLDGLVFHLKDKETFMRPNMIPSLVANHPKYNEKGRYWQGGVWAPTNYMTITGLQKKGYTDLAYEITTNHYKQIFEVYKQTGTFFEYYSPEHCEPGFMARPDFVGWTGLAPISLLFEQLIGIDSDFPNKKIYWQVRQTERHGIQQYPFGQEGTVDLVCKARSNAKQQIEVEVKTNTPFVLVLQNGNQQKEFNVQEGTAIFKL